MIAAIDPQDRLIDTPDRLDPLAARAAEDEVINARVNALALRVQANDLAELAELFETLQPIAWGIVARFLAPGRLPALLDLDDVRQQVWVILIDLAGRWRPDGGDFGAYFRVALPFELARFVNHNTPARRARATRVEGLDLDELAELCADRIGVDGRAWDQQIGLAEALDELTPACRQLVLRHVADGEPLGRVARELGISATVAKRELAEALTYLRTQLRPGYRPPAEPAETPPIVRLVDALHAGLDYQGRLPGRVWVCREADISESHFAQMMGVLVDSGCVFGRFPRHSGYLADPTPAATLRRLGLSRAV